VELSFLDSEYRWTKRLFRVGRPCRTYDILPKLIVLILYFGYKAHSVWALFKRNIIVYLSLLTIGMVIRHAALIGEWAKRALLLIE